MGCTYKANSNQLTSLTDGGTTDFTKASAYTYESDVTPSQRHLLTDQGKVITAISYNSFNLPGTVSRAKSQGGNITYAYAASGQKLSTILYTP